MFGDDVDEAQAQFNIYNFKCAAIWVVEGDHEALCCHLSEEGRGLCVYETDESGDNLLDLAIKHDAGPRVVRVLVRYDVEVYQGLLDTAVDLGRDDAVIALLELGVYMNSYFGDWRSIIESSLWKSDEVLLIDDSIECGMYCRGDVTHVVAMLRCEVAEQVRRAERMISSSRFPGTDDYAACEWLRGFCERHPETPEARLCVAIIDRCEKICRQEWKMQLVMLRALVLEGRAIPVPAASRGPRPRADSVQLAMFCSSAQSELDYGGYEYAGWDGFLTPPDDEEPELRPYIAALTSLPSRAFATVLKFWGGQPVRKPDIRSWASRHRSDFW